LFLEQAPVDVQQAGQVVATADLVGVAGALDIRGFPLTFLRNVSFDGALAGLALAVRLLHLPLDLATNLLDEVPKHCIEGYL